MELGIPKGQVEMDWKKKLLPKNVKNENMAREKNVHMDLEKGEEPQGKKERIVGWNIRSSLAVLTPYSPHHCMALPPDTKEKCNRLIASNKPRWGAIWTNPPTEKYDTEDTMWVEKLAKD